MRNYAQHSNLGDSLLIFLVVKEHVHDLIVMGYFHAS